MSNINFNHHSKPNNSNSNNNLKEQSFSKRNEPAGQFKVNGLEYASASEAACAMLMERYIPNFKIIVGKTFQVEIGRNHCDHAQHVDFQVNSVLFEFHPPRLWRYKDRLGDFTSYQEKAEFYKIRKELKGQARKEHIAKMSKIMTENYYKKRKDIIEKSSEHKGKELIVTVDASDFYHKVIARFGVRVPSEKHFVAMFEQIRNDICKHSRITKADRQKGNIIKFPDRNDNRKAA
jgi:hypothetical protein